MRIERIEVQREKDEQGPADIELLNPLIEKYKDKKGNLIPLLQGAQDIFGYIPRVAFEKLSKETGIALSEMYGVATFYAQFRLNPVGKHIVKVCHGTACHVQNAKALTTSLKEALKVEDTQWKVVLPLMRKVYELLQQAKIKVKITEAAWITNIETKQTTTDGISTGPVTTKTRTYEDWSWDKPWSEKTQLTR